ncbi:MAG: hypothetical protein KF729_22100 [Sandaracinaceae bacterium]|nr:hypothetical protein [Sandaracinaceae bacterium]
MTRAARWDLARLIHPFSPSDFFASRFESAMLHVPREDRSYYESLLSMDEIDRVLTTLHLNHPSVHMVNAAKPELTTNDYCYPSGLIDAARLYQEYEQGGTIVLNQLEGSLPTLMSLCRSMEAEFSSRFQCNIYVTPPNAQGLKSHYDSHCVFVLQIAGEKRWVTYDAPVERPLRGQEFTPDKYQAGEKSSEFVLHPGDMVYVPRGLMHDAVSTDAPSCHITLGVLPNSWTDLLLEAIARVGLVDPELRRSLPVGFASQGFDRTKARAFFRELLGRAAEQADFDAALDHFAEDLVSTRHALVYGQMRQIERLASLTVDDRAAPRPSLLFHLEKDEERVRVMAYGGAISLPIHAAESLEHALTADEYRIGDLPGELDDPGKLVLIRKLVREGLVEVL